MIESVFLVQGLKKWWVCQSCQEGTTCHFLLEPIKSQWTLEVIEVRLMFLDHLFHYCLFSLELCCLATVDHPKGLLRQTQVLHIGHTQLRMGQIKYLSVLKYGEYLWLRT